MGVAIAIALWVRSKVRLVHRRMMELTSPIALRRVLLELHL
jgi:hypothetical protein